MYAYVLQVVSFRQVSPQKSLECVFLFSNTCYRPHSSVSPWSDHLSNVYSGLQSWNSSLCGFLQFPVHASVFGTKIFLSAHIQNAFSLCSSFIMRDQVSDPHKTTHKIIVMCNLHIYRYQTGRQKIFTERLQVFCTFNVLLISPCIQFWFVNIIAKYLNFITGYSKIKY